MARLQPFKPAVCAHCRGSVSQDWALAYLASSLRTVYTDGTQSFSVPGLTFQKGTLLGPPSSFARLQRRKAGYTSYKSKQARKLYSSLPRVLLRTAPAKEQGQIQWGLNPILGFRIPHALGWSAEVAPPGRQRCAHQGHQSCTGQAPVVCGWRRTVTGICQGCTVGIRGGHKRWTVAVVPYHKPLNPN